MPEPRPAGRRCRSHAPRRGTIPTDPLPTAGLVDHARVPVPHSDPTIGVADAGQAESDLAAA